MKKSAIALAIASLSAATQAGTVTSDGADIVVSAKSGFEAKTTDGDYAFKIGGRVQIDYDSYDGVINAVPGENGSDLYFRRARLEIKGKAKDWGYEFSYNLTGSGSIDQLHTTFAGWGDLAEITVGQQKEDFGLEDTGSSKWITAVERSLPSSAFDTGNNLGIKLHGANDFLTYSLGAYKTGIDSDNDLDSAVTGRLVIRPYMDGDNLIHLGVGATTRSGVSADYNSRLGVRGGEEGDGAGRVRARYRIAGVTQDGDRDDYNIEAAVNFGPFHLTAEYFDGEADVDTAPVTVESDGYYVQAGYVLTGESRSYKTGIAAFDKVKPANAGGAWEVFARFDSLDVNNAAPVSVAGEQADTITLGVNWYLNSLVKMSVNYVNVETDQPIGGEDDGDALVARLQVAF
ncbi:MAG: porin [Porticoccaceae bacterium]|nr:porin [Porticoccaceae bacterium]